MTHVKPTSDKFYVALSALLHDADLWGSGFHHPEASGERLLAAADRASGLGLSELAWSSHWDGIDAYASVQDVFASLAGDVGRTHFVIGSELRQAHDVYVQTDQEALHDLNRTW